jgi:16S rRNA (adenine1518-N6/adenine1519-N6)-dimethyltransferase
MVPLAKPPGVDRALLGELVTAAFSQRRKLLRHSLGRWLEQRGSAAGAFDLQRRAEEVPVADYVALAAAIAPLAGAHAIDTEAVE